MKNLYSIVYTESAKHLWCVSDSITHEMRYVRMTECSTIPYYKISKKKRNKEIKQSDNECKGKNQKAPLVLQSE